MSHPVSPEAFPTVSVDRSYADALSSIDVDAMEIAAYLRERGMSDDDIGALTIHFSSEISREKSSQGTYRTAGRYQDESSLVTIYRPSVLFSYKAPIAEGSKEKLVVSGDTFTNELVNETLVHELEHSLDFKTEVMVEVNGQHYKNMQERLTKRLRKIGIKAGMALATAYGAMTLGNHLTSEAIEAQGGDATASGFAFTGGTLALAALATIGARRKMVKEADRVNREAYLSSPLEIKARAAESTHVKEFVTVNAKPELHESLEKIVALSLSSVGATADTLAAE
jgi:hypothetical protein